MTHDSATRARDLVAGDSALPNPIAAAAAPTKATKEQRQTLIATGMGNALEWYDWGIYSAFAIYFATEVFNPKDPLAALLGAMAVFAVGFVARPVGGFVFGWLADTWAAAPP